MFGWDIFTKLPPPIRESALRAGSSFHLFLPRKLKEFLTTAKSQMRRFFLDLGSHDDEKTRTRLGISGCHTWTYQTIMLDV